MSIQERSRFDVIQAQIGELDAEVRKLKLQDINRPPESPIGIPGVDFETPTATRKLKKAERKVLNNSPEARAFRNYLRSGYDGERYGLPKLSAEDRTLLRYERRDMGVGSPTASIATSVLVPQGFVYEIESALKFYNPLFNTSTILDTATGEPLPYPTANDTSISAEIVGEGSQVSAADVSVSNIVFNAYKFSTKLVKVSLELLQDSPFDIEAFLKEQFSVRLGRALATYFVTGTGSAQPYGILTQATAGPTATGSSKNTGGSETGATSIGSADIVNLIQSVEPVYRPGAAFLMHDQTRLLLESTLDKYGRPLFVADQQTGRLERLYGYPIYLSNAMPTVATTQKTILFGRLDKYTIRRVRGLSVLRLVERFADYGQVAFIGFARYDGNLLDAGTHPVKYLVQA
jgi:HK97 family phage major capsid protein